MADGSVIPATEAGTTSPTSTLLLGQDHVLDFILPVEAWGPENQRQVAERLMRLANSTLRLVSCRGEDETDPPGTLAEAVEAVSVLLQVAIGALESAAEKEASHG